MKNKNQKEKFSKLSFPNSPLDPEAICLRNFWAFYGQEVTGQRASFLRQLSKSDSLKQALSISDTLSQNLHSYAYYSLAAKKHEKAVRYYKALILLDPNRYEYWLGLGVAYKQARKLNLAAAALDNAISLKAEMAAPFAYLSQIHLEQGNYDKSRDSLGVFYEKASEPEIDSFQSEISKIHYILDKQAGSRG